MPIGINGSGTITGISAGGLPDNVIVADDIAAGAVAPAKLSTGAPSWDSSGNLSFNSGYGSVATAYGCRAWVHFDGTTSTPSIRASGNVSSITDNGVGDYNINFATAMPDANYCIAVASNGPVNTAHTVTFVGSITASNFNFAQFITTNSTVRADPVNAHAAVFR